MRNLLNIVVSLLLLAGRYSTAAAQDEPNYQRWMAEGRCYLDGSYGKEKRDEAIKWFRRVKRCYYFNKTIRGQAMLGIADYQLYKDDTAAAIKTLRQVIGNRMASKIEKGNAGKIRKRKKEEWNRYYAASALLQLHLTQHAFEKAHQYVYYLDKKVSVNWYCGDGILSHNMMSSDAYVKIQLYKNNPDSAFFYWYDGWFDFRTLMNTFGKGIEENDSLIFSALLKKYGKDTLINTLKKFRTSVYWRDAVSATDITERRYYADFSGIKIVLEAVYGDSAFAPFPEEYHKAVIERLDKAMAEHWMLKTLLKTGS
jgi:hypothetical protein